MINGRIADIRYSIPVDIVWADARYQLAEKMGIAVSSMNIGYRFSYELKERPIFLNQESWPDMLNRYKEEKGSGSTAQKIIGLFIHIFNLDIQADTTKPNTQAAGQAKKSKAKKVIVSVYCSFLIFLMIHAKAEGNDEPEDALTTEEAKEKQQELVDSETNGNYKGPDAVTVGNGTYKRPNKLQAWQQLISQLLYCAKCSPVDPIPDEDENKCCVDIKGEHITLPRRALMMWSNTLVRRLIL